MNFDEEKWSQLVRQWDDEDSPPDVISGAAENVEPEADESVMTLPEMDFSGPVETAETRTSVAPAVASAPAPSLGTSSKPMQSSTPSGGASSPDWAELGRRLKIGNMSKASSQAYENQFANAGATGAYRPNPHAGEVGPALVKGDLDILGAKQGTERHDAAMADRKATAGVRAAMDDPNSLQSQKARESVKAFFGDMTLPRGFENWSANDVGKFANSGTLARVKSQQNAAADDARKVAGDAAKAESAANDLAASRKNWTNELKDLGIDPTTASQKDIDRAMQAKHAKATEAVAASNNAIAQSNRKDKDDDRGTLGEGIPFAGGELKYSGKSAPLEQDKRKAVEIAAGWNAALSGMDQLEKSLTSYAQHPGPETKRDVDSKVRVVSSALNSAVGGGAMSQDEAVAMSQALGADLLSPTGIEAFARSVFGDDGGAAKALTTRLKSVRESAKATALGKLKSYRFDFSGGGEQAAPEETREVGGKTYRKKNGKWVTGG